MKPLRSIREPTRSTIVRGLVRHWRGVPRAHSFVYPMLTLQLDLDELESDSFSSILFGYNRWSVCSVRGDDYLSGAGTLRSKVEEVLKGQGCSVSPHRIMLITMPRYFGYVFNPVSFFLCFTPENQIIACVTQVNNTFGESHLYPLVCGPCNAPVTWTFPKRFFVSPFFDTQGEYTLGVVSSGERVMITVDLQREGQTVFAASLEGSARPLSNCSLLKALVCYPITLLLTMPRIHLQAILLFFRAKATPCEKPNTAEPYTIRSNPNSIHKMRLAFLSVLRASRKA